MIELIRERLKIYNPATPVEEEQAVKEILQEIALYALWRADFFEVAAFQGGTSLRILHKLPRFSEDLDFILKEPNPEFKWSGYLDQLLDGLQQFGLKSEVLDKSHMDQNIRKAVLRDDSIANQLNLSFYRGAPGQKINIKLEIDIKPPQGSSYEYTYLDFPTDFEVCHQDLNSNFALKIHALLCRPYLKGRDWFDFNWYVKQRIQPNFTHLQAALHQYGPWAGQGITIDINWLRAELLEKIDTIDWKQAAADVERFLNASERKGLELWSKRFFETKVEKLFT